MSNILLELVVESSPEAVYKAITEKEGIHGWWTTDTSIEAKEGTEARFGFGPKGEFSFNVAKLAPNQCVEWDSPQGPPDWAGTDVRFDLEAVDEGTKILFGHRNYSSEEGSFAMVSFNWAYFLMSLKSYLETGQGMPAKV
jgi:uncharacterized protein YndB with AHSA1/START domain